jgi:hypothetical protein
MITRYLLRVNTDKFPEVYAELEKHKQKNGVAGYLRKLIEDDIARQQNLEVATMFRNEVATTLETPRALPKYEQPEPVAQVVQSSQLDNIDDEEDEDAGDFMGGLA